MKKVGVFATAQLVARRAREADAEPPYAFGIAVGATADWINRRLSSDSGSYPAMDAARAAKKIGILICRNSGF